jgi:hypothetical protein
MYSMQYLLRKKESDRLKNSLGEALVSKIKSIDNISLCGGALTSIFRKAEINDFDLYFQTEKAFTDLNAYLKERGSGYKLVSETINSNTFVGETLNNFFKSKKLQLIKKPQVYCKPVEQILNCFDFTICQAGYLFNKEIVVVHENFIFDLAKRELILNKDTATPLNTLVRLRKYLARGFIMPPKEMVRLGMMVNKLDLKNKQVVIDNLAGLGSQEINEVIGRFQVEGEINVEEVLQELLDI